MGLVVITPPADEPITLEEVKKHLRVDSDWTADDDYIQGLIVAARNFCEKRQRRAYMTQTLEYSADHFPTGRRLELPRPPLREVVSVTYTDADGAEHIFSATNYLVDTRSLVGSVTLKRNVCWPSVTLSPVNGVVVRYVAGYGDASAVPETIKQAMKLLIGHWFERREAVLTGSISKEIEFSTSALLGQERVP